MDISHYITLPCKVTHSSNPENKLSNFTIALAEEFELQDEWEIGLSEISYPKNWLRLPCDQKIDILYFKSDESNYFKSITSDDLIISKGYYTFLELFNLCNKTIASVYDKVEGKSEWVLKDMPSKILKDVPKLTIYKSDLYFFPAVSIENEFLFVRFDKILGNMLGLDYYILTNFAYNYFDNYHKILSTQSELPPVDYSLYPDGPRFQAWKSPNLDRNLKYLYVCSDVIKNERYRTKKNSLLRIVDIPESKVFGDQITQIYDRIYYFPLKKNRIDKINIQIFLSDENESEHVPFLFGEAYLILHLRKIYKNVKISGEDPSCQQSVDINRENAENHETEEDYVHPFAALQES